MKYFFVDSETFKNLALALGIVAFTEYDGEPNVLLSLSSSVHFSCDHVAYIFLLERRDLSVTVTNTLYCILIPKI